MRLTLILTILTVLAAGCATKGSKLNLKKLKPGQKIFIGNWHFDFKKAPAEDFRCEVFANTTFSPVMQINQNPKGYFISNEKSLKFVRVGCLGFDRVWYNYDIKITPLTPNYNSPSIVYYGDFYITIDPDHGIQKKKIVPKKKQRKVAAEERRDADEMMNEKVQDQGKFTLKIVDNFEKTKNDFEKEYGNQLSGHVYARALLKDLSIVKPKKKKSKRRSRRRRKYNKKRR